MVDRINIADGKLFWTVSPDSKAGTRLVGSKPRARHPAWRGRDRALRAQDHAHTLKALRAADIEKIEVEQAELDGAMTASDIIDLPPAK